MHTFPFFKIILQSGQALDKTVIPGGSLQFESGYGQAAHYTLSIKGKLARDIFDSGVLQHGTIMAEVHAGYRDGGLELMGRNLLIWEDNYDSSSEGGDTLSVHAFGCSQYLRNSGQRRQRLAAKTFADAAKEIANRHGLKMFVADTAYRKVRLTPPPATPADPTNTGTTGMFEATPTAANDRVMGQVNKILAGNYLGLTDDVKNTPFLCARFVRQVVEAALGSWQVSRTADALAVKNGHDVRYATDFEEASRQLGLAATGAPLAGDILYRDNDPPTYGHTAIFIGNYNGVDSVIENTTANRGRDLLGGGRPIRVTPYSVWGTPSTIARPAITAEERAAKKAAASAAPKNVAAKLPTGETAVVDTPPSALALYQTGQNDWDFLSELAKQIGFVIAESDLGDTLYFGPGLAVGEKPRKLLVRGKYSVRGRNVPGLIRGISCNRNLFGLPTEIMVTGIDNGKRFNVLITPNDLAQNHALSSNPAQTATRESGDALQGAAGKNITGTVEVANAAKKQTKVEAFASTSLGALLKSANLPGRRMILEGSINAANARRRGIEALSLEQLKFSTVTITIPGIASLRAGHEVEIQGTEIPARLRGVYMVRTVSGTSGADAGFEMSLTLVKNTVRG